MRKYEKKEIISKLRRTIFLNSNTLNFEQCYHICANKNKLEELLRRENQIVFGRRGTGKTTIFKAFTYFVNEIYEENYSSCWYTRLDECIPTGIEIADDNLDNIVLFCIKKFLEKFIKFLYQENEKIENGNRHDYRTKEKIADSLLKLSDLVENGSKITQKISETESINDDTFSQRERDISMGSPSEEFCNIFRWFHLKFSRQKNYKREISSTKEKGFVYQIDINELKEAIDSLLEIIGYDVFYVCIDEFSQIDRDIPYTIQPAVAQIIKQLFFNSTTVVVKIASVWNEARMQNRQVNGNREGMELGHDIFQNDELNLDTMFKHSNDDAMFFFKEVLLNDVLLYEYSESPNERERNALSDYIIDQLFAHGSFRHLVCGSQGIPRIFGILLENCLKQLNDRKKDKITVEIIFESIINNYLYDIRQSIPYTSPICVSIDDYVSRTKHRYFLVTSADYNIGINFFDGLVANNALHQCPSEQLPRQLRNRYKLFYVHYGNYLESFKDGGTSEFNYDASIMDSGYLFPQLPRSLLEGIDEYVLTIPDHAFDKMFCTYCHKYFDKIADISNPLIYKCPICNKPISYWS